MQKYVLSHFEESLISSIRRVYVYFKIKETTLLEL